MILGSQSVKNAVITTGATAGFDAGKLVKGRKRLVLTDTLVSRLLPVHAGRWPGRHRFLERGATAHDLLDQVQMGCVDVRLTESFANT